MSISNENTPLLSGDNNTRNTAEDAPKQSKSPRSFYHTLLKTGLGRTLLAVLAVVFGMLFLTYLIGPFDLKDQLASVPKVSLNEFSVDRLTDDGLNIKVAGQVIADYSDVNGTLRRGLVKTIGGWLKTVEVRNSTLDIFFEDEDWKEGDHPKNETDARTVRATIPPMTVDIKQGHNTSFDIVTTLSDFGSSDVIESIVDRLIHAQEVKFVGRANITAGKFGLFVGPIPLAIKESINKPEDDDDDDDDGSKSFFGYNISDINVTPKSGSKDSLAVGFSAFVENSYDISMSLPPLLWEVSIEGCDSMVPVVDGVTNAIDVKPFTAVNVSVDSNVGEIPKDLLKHCSNDNKSPLDRFIHKYLSGSPTSLLVAGKLSGYLMPKWLEELLQHVSIKLNFKSPGQKEDLIESVSFQNLKLELPESKNPLVKPKGPPRISAIVSATCRAPSKIIIADDVKAGITNARGVSGFFSEDKEFARVILEDWVPCMTRREENTSDMFIVDFALDSVPLDITDQAVFGKVIQTILVNGQAPIRIEAIADAELRTPIGEFVLTEIPAKGDTVIKQD